MYPLKIIILISLYLLSSSAFPLSETKSIIRENIFLKSEYSLALGSKNYVVFDLREKRVLIKAKGIILREFKINSFKLWGYPILPEPLTLIKKGSIIKPKRKKIIPLKIDEKGTGEFEYIELEKMPSRYKLKLDGSIWVYIIPESDNLLTKTLNLYSIMKSLLFTKPIGSLWYNIFGKKFTQIDIYMDKNEAKSIFWSFLEGYRCIIYNYD